MTRRLTADPTPAVVGGIPYGERTTEYAWVHPGKTAVMVAAADGTEQQLTWSEVEHRAVQWGRFFAASGAELGSLVALAIPNSIDLITATLGCWKIGAVPVPTRWDLPDWELTRLLAVIDAAVVLDRHNRAEIAGKAAAESISPLPAAISPYAYGICSSGSTGTPKVILNANPGLWTPAKSEPFIRCWTDKVSRPQTVLVPGPMYHTNGFHTLHSLLGGDRLVVLEKFDATRALDLIERDRVTHFTATPTMLARMAGTPDIADRDLSSMEWILQGAATIPESVLLRWFELLGPERIVMAYGMTEALGLTALRGDEWLDHRGSVGRGFNQTEVRILRDDGSIAPVGEIGEIYLRTPSAAGYRYLGAAQPLPRTADGFSSVGDLGRLDADGYLYIADRRSDVIITGGANVYPAEVEAALGEHPGIADVVVIGLSDEQWGKRVHAVVQARDGAGLDQAEVIRYAKGRLAAYKVPKTVEFVAEIPRSAATKVSRSAMIAARGG